MKKLLILLTLPLCFDANAGTPVTKICKTDMEAYRKEIKPYLAVNLMQQLPNLSKFTTCTNVVKTPKHSTKKFVKTKGKL